MVMAFDSPHACFHHHSRHKRSFSLQDERYLQGLIATAHILDCPDSTPTFREHPPPMQPPTHIKQHCVDLVLDNHPLNHCLSPFQCFINPQITLRDLFQIEEAPGFSSDNCTIFSSCGSSSSSLNSCSLYEEKFCNINNPNYSKPSFSSRMIMSPPNLHIASSNVIARLMGIQDFPQNHRKELRHGRNTACLTNTNNKCDTIRSIRHFSEEQMKICQEEVPTKAERLQRGFSHGQAKSISEDELKPVSDESNYGFMSKTIEKRLAQLGLQSSEKERRCLAHLLEMMKQKGHTKSRVAQAPKDLGNSTKLAAMPLIPPISQHSMLKGSLGDSITDSYPVNPMKISKFSSSELHSAGIESSLQDINDLSFCNSFIKLACMPSTTHPSSQSKFSSGYSSKIMSSSISSNADINAISLSANCSNSVQERDIDSSDQASEKKVSESELSGKELNSCEEKRIVEADVKLAVQEEKGGRAKTESLVSTKTEATCTKVEDLVNPSALKSKSGKQTGNSRLVKGAATNMASIKATPKFPQYAKKQSMLSSNSTKSSWKQPGKPNLEPNPSKKPNISKPLLTSSKVRDQRQCHDRSNILSSKGGDSSLTKQDSNTLRGEPYGRKKQQSKATLSIKPPPNRSRNEGEIKREAITRLPRKATPVLEQRKSSFTSSSNSNRNRCSDQSQRKNESISLQERSKSVIKSGCKAASKPTRINNKKASLQETNQTANEQQTESKPCNRAGDTLNANDRAEGGNIPNNNGDETSKEGYKGIDSGRNDENLGNLSVIRGDKEMACKGEAGSEIGWLSQWLTTNSNLLADVDSSVDPSARSAWQGRVILDCVAAVLAGRLTCAFQQLHMGRHVSTRHVPGGLPEMVARQVSKDVVHLQNLCTSSAGEGEKVAVLDDLADGRDTWHVQLDGEVIHVVRVMEEMILGDVLQEELSSLSF